MATREICGQPTEKGPCTLEPGHKLNYHRHRVYDTVEWIITTPRGKELLKGTGRLNLQYALNDAFIKSTKIIISAELVVNTENVPA